MAVHRREIGRLLVQSIWGRGKLLVKTNMHIVGIGHL